MQFFFTVTCPLGFEPGPSFEQVCQLAPSSQLFALDLRVYLNVHALILDPVFLPEAAYWDLSMGHLDSVQQVLQLAPRSQPPGLQYAQFLEIYLQVDHMIQDAVFLPELVHSELNLGHPYNKCSN
jgi:hypothetical protein